MQKKLIALAIAGLASSAAFAQSNVTVYGVVDVYAATSGATGNAAKTSVNSGGIGGSRLGFKGVEDLGNGLKALFTLEYAISPDSTAGQVGTSTTANARQQFVGLTGGFGTAVAGSLQTAGYDFSAATNAMHGTAINPLDTVSPTRAAAAGGLLNSSSRASNAVAYISPSFGGVTIAVNHARLSEGANAVTGSDGFANLVSATYANGPLTVAAVTTSAVVTPNVTGFALTGSVKESGLGGAYDFGVATLKASYLTRKVDESLGNTQNKSDKAWQISGIVPVSAVGKVVLGYAKSTVDSTDTATTSPSDNSKSYSVAYLHSLSKRTTAYAGYQHVSNDNAAALGTALQAPTTGGSARAFVAGVNHSF